MSSPGYRDDREHSPNAAPNYRYLDLLASPFAESGEVCETRLFKHPLIMARATRWVSPSDTKYTEPTHEVVIPLGEKRAHIAVSNEGLINFEVSNPDNPFAEAETALANAYIMPPEQSRLTADFLRLFADEFDPESGFAADAFMCLRNRLKEILEFKSSAADHRTASMDTVDDIREAIENIASNAELARVASTSVRLPDNDDEYNRQLHVRRITMDGGEPSDNLSVTYLFHDSLADDYQQSVNLIVDDGNVMIRTGAAWTYDDETEMRDQIAASELVDNSRLEMHVKCGYRYADKEDLMMVEKILRDAIGELTHPNE